MVLSVVGAGNGGFGAVVDCQARDALPTERDGAVANDAGETEVVDGEKIGRDPAAAIVPLAFLLINENLHGGTLQHTLLVACVR